MNGFHSLEAMWDTFPPVYRANLLFALGTANEGEARKQAQETSRWQRPCRRSAPR